MGSSGTSIVDPGPAGRERGGTAVADRTRRATAPTTHGSASALRAPGGVVDDALAPRAPVAPSPTRGRPLEAYVERELRGRPARFRKTYRQAVAVGVLLSVGAHFLAFRFLPRFQIGEMAASGVEMAAVSLPPEVRVPPPPEQIARPAIPKVGAIESEDITIAPTTFEANPVETLPPPPAVTASVDDRPSFIPYDTPPRLRNGEEVLRLLERHYPVPLKQAGVGGTVGLWLFLDAEGSVQKTLVKESSGHPLLDGAAQEVAAAMSFVPALNRDRPTAVWVSQVLIFEVKDRRGGM